MKMSNELALFIMLILFIVLMAGTIISLVALTIYYAQSFLVLVAYVLIYNIIRAIYRSINAIEDDIKRGKK